MEIKRRKRVPKPHESTARDFWSGEGGNKHQHFLLDVK